MTNMTISIEGRVTYRGELRIKDNQLFSHSAEIGADTLLSYPIGCLFNSSDLPPVGQKRQMRISIGPLNREFTLTCENERIEDAEIADMFETFTLGSDRFIDLIDDELLVEILDGVLRN